MIANNLESLRGISATWSDWMIAMSWQVAILGIAILLITALLRRAPASIRAGLWALVFIKLLIPPALAIPWTASSGVSVIALSISREYSFSPRTIMAPSPTNSGDPAAMTFDIATAIFVVWLSIALTLFAIGAFQYLRFSRNVLRSLKSPSVRTIAVADRTIEAYGITNTVLIRVSRAVDTPCVFGVFQPVVVLPIRCDADYGEEALANVIAHEIAHIRRKDLVVSGAMAILTCLYWYHPVVWFANVFYRKEREMACDDLAIRHVDPEGSEYAKTLMAVAEDAQVTAPMVAGFLGATESGENMVQRMRSAGDRGRMRKAGRIAWALVIALACVAIPMGIVEQPVVIAVAPEVDTTHVVSTSPPIGATDVDPETTTLTLTFDRAMGGGMSWTGGGEAFPEFTAKPTWDAEMKSCTAPVKLKPGKYYRVGVNASSFRNFKSADGTPAQFEVLYFVTRGASAEEKAKATKPEIVSMVPENGATVDAATTTQMVVTFDRKMGGGMSWAKSGGAQPESNGRPMWNDDMTACTLPVSLKPGIEYSICINHPYANNFQSEWGVPVDPIIWTFTTK